MDLFEVRAAELETMAERFAEELRRPAGRAKTEKDIHVAIERQLQVRFSSRKVGDSRSVSLRKTLKENGLRQARASGSPSAGTTRGPPYRPSPTRFARTGRATVDRVPSRRPFGSGLPTFWEETPKKVGRLKAWEEGGHRFSFG
jgi:hypothetical protein